MSFLVMTVLFEHFWQLAFVESEHCLFIYAGRDLTQLRHGIERS